MFLLTQEIHNSKEKSNIFTENLGESCFYTWDDQIYRDFMSMILVKLEPRMYTKHTIILDEFEEPNEVVFVMRGAIVVGYEVNKVKKYSLKIKNKIGVGAFGCSFNKRSEFIYTALNDVHAYAIRKESWLDLLESNEEIAVLFKKKLAYNYFK